MKARSKYVLAAAVLAALVAGFFLVPARCFSQAETRPDVGKEMTDAFGAMGPMMGKMMATMLDSMFDVLAKKESADKLATFCKNYHDALVAKGFTKEQAMQIVVATGVPSAGMMK